MAQNPFKALNINTDKIEAALTQNGVTNFSSIVRNERETHLSGTYKEIDFLINAKDGIIPIEVKANTNNNSKSLNLYMEKYKPSFAIRISSKNFGFENNIKSVPLYATFCISEFEC